MSTDTMKQHVSPDDHAWIEKFRLGSRTALGEIYQRYKQDLFLLALSLLRDAHGAEDTIQDVFTRFARNGSQFHLTGSLRSYLLVCVANRARNHFRNDQRHHRAESRYAMPDDIEEPEPRVIGNEQMAQLERAMDHLSYEQREAVLLHTHGQMTFSAIAENLNVSVNTAKSRYRYGIENLRRFFEGEAKP
jgi:RNA polymerase sigma-70 factor (ECF subfamily)